MFGDTQTGKSQYFSGLEGHFQINGEFNAGTFPIKESEIPRFILIQDIRPGGMPPNLNLLLQGAPLSFTGKYQKTRDYPGGAPCILTLNYDLRDWCAGIKEFPQEWWFNENVIFVNIGSTPLWLREGEEDRWYKATEMESNIFGRDSSCPTKFKNMQEELHKKQRMLGEKIKKWYKGKKLQREGQGILMELRKEKAGKIIWKFWKKYNKI